MAAHAESIGSKSSRTQNQIDKLAAVPTRKHNLSAEGRAAARALLYEIRALLYDDINEQPAAKARKLGGEPAEPQTAEPAEPEADDDEEDTQRF